TGVPTSATDVQSIQTGWVTATSAFGAEQQAHQPAHAEETATSRTTVNRVAGLVQRLVRRVSRPGGHPPSRARRSADTLARPPALARGPAGMAHQAIHPNGAATKPPRIPAAIIQ